MCHITQDTKDETTTSQDVKKQYVVAISKGFVRFRNEAILKDSVYKVPLPGRIKGLYEALDQVIRISSSKDVVV